jgi:probable HAF family extracellular repeat protein
MSASGRVTGLLELADNSQHAMTWAPQQAMLDLGTLGGNLASANAANNRGQVVGGSSTASGPFHAFVWTSKEGMVDLNTRLRHAPAGLTLYSADAVSDNGAIVASANTGLVLLTPDKGRHTGHTAGPIVCPDMVRAGTPLDASLGFVTEEPSATYKATWSWGDGSGDQAAATSAPAGEGKAAASHVYTAPGMYTVTASVADAAGNSTKVTRKVIVYEPSEGVVGGAGAFVSPAKRIGKGTMPGGRATFSFVAPSVPAAKAARTNGQLTFSLGGMNFQSVSLGLTALQGTSAQFAGSGKMNGAGNYKFTLQTTTGAANPGQPGRFGLRIWHADPATGSDIVDYDNLGTGTGSDAAGHPIAEGAITVQR